MARGPFAPGNRLGANRLSGSGCAACIRCKNLQNSESRHLARAAHDENLAPVQEPKTGARAYRDDAERRTARRCRPPQQSHQHDGDAMRQILNGGNVVRDKEKGKPKPFLERLEKKDDARAQRDVQSRGRLVEDDETRMRGDGARNVDALPLPIGKLVRIALYKVGSIARAARRASS